MNVDIRYLGFRASEELKGHVQYRFRTAFEKMARYIDQITVRIIDLSGGRNIGDKRCRVFLRLKSAQTLFVEEFRPNMIELVDCVSAKAASSATVMVEERRAPDKRVGG